VIQVHARSTRIEVFVENEALQGDLNNFGHESLLAARIEAGLCINIGPLLLIANFAIFISSLLLCDGLFYVSNSHVEQIERQIRSVSRECSCCLDGPDEGTIGAEGAAANPTRARFLPH
jgi:hypothetical protein